jgi:hypothetical protein
MLSLLWGHHFIVPYPHTPFLLTHLTHSLLLLALSRFHPAANGDMNEDVLPEFVPIYPMKSFIEA